MPSPRKAPSLAQLIRRSAVLDAAARRRWLAVLPHLTDEDRERLREILSDDVQERPPTSAPERPLPTATPEPERPLPPAERPTRAARGRGGADEQT